MTMPTPPVDAQAIESSTLPCYHMIEYRQLIPAGDIDHSWAFA